MNNHPVHHSNPGEPVAFIVDDDAGLRESLGSLLRSIGLRVELFASVTEFMNHPRPETVSCLVLDVHLGEISGIELGQRLVAEGRYAPFICITAEEEPGTRALADAAGCAAFFRKTDSGAAVLAAIRRAAL